MAANQETQRMDEAGICYDWAMPQEWFNDVLETTNLNPAGHVVWLYDKRAGIFGRPYAIDMLGWIIRRVYDIDCSMSILQKQRKFPL